MKIFWSWQSDVPGNIGRHFVRKAIEEALRSLKEEPDVEEPLREAELDHDRKGVPGSPDLAAIILKKISNSQVFVADVTPIGAVTANESGKKLINSNVAIELGYAMKALGDGAILMVMNEAFGEREELPFDLRHKAGPILYRLAEDASKEEIKKEQQHLIGKLKLALREMALAAPQPEVEAFKPIAAAEDNPGRFWTKDEVLARREENWRQGAAEDFKCADDALLYMRFIPTTTAPKLSRVDALEIASNHLNNFGLHSNPHSINNEYGTLVISSTNDSKMLSATQLFLSREIWGFDGYSLTGWNKKLGFPTAVYERHFAVAVQNYIQVATKHLKLNAPFELELGAANVKGFSIFMPRKYWPREVWGPIHDRHIFVRERINSLNPVETDRVLLSFFEKIFDSAAEKRPEKFNNFPGETPGSLPH